MKLSVKKPSEFGNHSVDCGSSQSHLSNIEVTQETQKLQQLWVVLGLRGSLFLVELGVGIWSHSLSLIAGSGHLFLDLVNLGLILLVTWLVKRQSVGQPTFRYQRVEIWVARANGLSLVFVALLIAIEAVGHLQSPEPIQGLPMLIVAGVSLVISGEIVHLLHEESHHDLNLRGVFLHGVADAASAVSVMLSAVAVYFWHWNRADAVASLLVATFLSLSAISLIKDSLSVK